MITSCLSESSSIRRRLKARVKKTGRVVNIMWGVKKNHDPIMYVVEEDRGVYYKDDLEFLPAEATKEELRGLLKCIVHPDERKTSI